MYCHHLLADYVTLAAAPAAPQGSAQGDWVGDRPSSGLWPAAAAALRTGACALYGACSASQVPHNLPEGPLLTHKASMVLDVGAIRSRDVVADAISTDPEISEIAAVSESAPTLHCRKVFWHIMCGPAHSRPASAVLIADYCSNDQSQVLAQYAHCVLTASFSVVLIPGDLLSHAEQGRQSFNVKTRRLCCGRRCSMCMQFCRGRRVALAGPP